MRYLDHRREGADAQLAAAGCDQGMHVDDGLASVEFLEHGLVHRMAQPFVAVIGLQVDAIRLDDVECVLDLLERGIDIHHRERREDPEAPRIILPHLGRIVLAHLRRLARRFGAIVEPQAGSGCERQHRRPDAALVHLFDRPPRCPVRYAGIRRDLARALPLHLSLEIGRRIKVMMGIDQVPLCLTARGRRRQQGCSADSCEPCEKLAPGRVARCADWAVVEIHGRSPGYILVKRVRPASSARFSSLRFAASKDGPIRHLEASMPRRKLTEGLVFIPCGTRHADGDG